MAKSVRYHKQGGPEVLQLDDVQVGDPGQEQVHIGHTAIGVNFVDTYQRSASYVDTIRKGAKPADLPVERPTKFDLVISLKTAKVLGIIIPQSVLLRANEVIQ